LSPYYAAEIDAAVANLTDPSLATAAESVKNIPTFIWLDVVAKVPDLETYLSEAQANGELLQIVVYDLPDRDCAALASNGEFSIADGGEEKYYDYIDQIVEQISGESKGVISTDHYSFYVFDSQPSPT
jgi:cellulose 1,4-beta-cellobiosidase